jgi:exodeoxyribonuclease V alpha subunit
VERITYQNEANGYTVIKCRAKNYQDLVTVVGAMPDVHVGSVLSLTGQWKVDAKYGRQFAMETFEETLPATVYGMEKYLGSGLIKGIGPKYAKKIVGQFGADTLNVIEDQPDRLLEIPGIGRARVESIKKSWLEQMEIKNIMVFLQSHDVSTSHATKIYKTYGNDSIKVVQENPYRLADDIWGIGFKTADTIAEKMGFGKEKYARLRSGLFYTLNKLSEDGHCYATRKMLLEKGAELLGVEDGLLAMTLDEMIRTMDVITDNIPQDSIHTLSAAQETDKSGSNENSDEVDYSLYEQYLSGMDASSNSLESGRISVSDTFDPSDPMYKAIYLPPFYFSETGTAKRLTSILHAQPSVHVDTGNLAQRITFRTGMQYDEIQMQAIQAAVTSKVLVLTGGPGTGKTTTTLGIITAFADAGAKILLAAPTGRAAKRLSEATGREAKTIHRLLEFKPPEGYQKNEEKPLEGDVLIVDECSMIDIMLMYNLLKAAPDSMTLILVGDIDQLPSVGAGNVLRDVIESGCVPVVRLKRIFRQAQKSQIIMNAHRINEGQMPDLSNGRTSDFFFMEEEDPEKAVATITKLVKENLSRYYRTPSSEIQVLTPMQRGVVGASNLNQALQEALNPLSSEGRQESGGSGGRGLYGYGGFDSVPFLRHAGMQFRQRDKVMQIRNNYDKEVFNGDIGIISFVDTQNRTLTVDFDGRNVSYDISELDELVLAYATTIHKSQGSEYPIVVMPVLMNHYVMLQRNLIYTGITRAKKILVIVGTRKALSYAVHHVTVTKRNTMLAVRIRRVMTQKG